MTVCINIDIIDIYNCFRCFSQFSNYVNIAYIYIYANIRLTKQKCYLLWRFTSFIPVFNRTTTVRHLSHNQQCEITFSEYHPLRFNFSLSFFIPLPTLAEGALTWRFEFVKSRDFFLWSAVNKFDEISSLIVCCKVESRQVLRSFSNLINVKSIVLLIYSFYWLDYFLSLNYQTAQ